MSKLYSYVGTKSKQIQELLLKPEQRTQITSPDDALRWIGQSREASSSVVTATFIINADQQLWVAERRSEHVICARGQEVLAAGEISFEESEGQIEVTEITNQSTGYCPEPESWPVVAAILDRIGLSHPSAFTMIFLFRRCDACNTINIVKDHQFVCAVCQTHLSSGWNFDKAPSRKYL